MPTAANKNILERNLSTTRVKPITEIGDPLLTEAINYATHVVLRCATSKQLSDQMDIDLAPIALYRQMIEFADGIQVLATNSICNPSTPLLRTLFEALLYIEYMLQTQATYKERALAWLVGYARQRLHNHKQFSAQTTQGQKFRKNWAADKISSRIPWSESAEANAAILNMESFLSKPHIKPINNKFDQFKKSRKRNPNWFSISNGPSSIENLSIELGRGGQYGLLYREWSRISHASDLINLIAPRDKKSVSGIKGLRDPRELKNIYSFCTTLLVDGTKTMLLKFRPGEEQSFAKWYKTEMSELHNLIHQLNVEFVYTT